jgi:hypothetical protein
MAGERIGKERDMVVYVSTADRSIAASDGVSSMMRAMAGEEE